MATGGNVLLGTEARSWSPLLSGQGFLRPPVEGGETSFPPFPLAAPLCSIIIGCLPRLALETVALGCPIFFPLRIFSIRLPASQSIQFPLIIAGGPGPPVLPVARLLRPLRLALEAVAFGSFLKEAETAVELTAEVPLLTPASRAFLTAPSTPTPPGGGGVSGWGIHRILIA